MKVDLYYDKVLKENFRKKFCELLDEGMFKDREFGDRIHVSYETVAKWRRGQAIPSLSNAKRIADFFYKDLDYFVD